MTLLQRLGVLLDGAPRRILHARPLGLEPPEIVSSDRHSARLDFLRADRRCSRSIPANRGLLTQVLRVASQLIGGPQALCELCVLTGERRGGLTDRAQPIDAGLLEDGERF